MDSFHNSKSTSSQSRIYTTLDGMRFVAAMIVVTAHVKLFDALALPERFLAVDLFFVLSGFVIAKAYENKLVAGMSPTTFLLRRVIRLYPLYLLGILLGLVADVIDSGNFTLRTLYHLIFSAFLLPNPDGWGDLFPFDGPMWSLFFEFLVNIIYVFALSKLRGRLLFIIMGFAAISLVVFAVGLHGVNFGWKLKTIPGGLSRVIFSFYAGVILYRFHSSSAGSREIIIKSNILSWTILVITGCLLCSPIPAQFGQAFELIAIFCLFPAFVFLAIHCEPKGQSSKAFLIGGVLSYAVYIIHEPLGRMLTPLLTSHGTNAAFSEAVTPAILFFVVLLAISICASYLYDIPLRKSFERWIRERDRRKSAHEVSRSLAHGATKIGGTN